MIVGTIQREDSCSWQDASRSWLEQDVEEEDGVYQVGTCQGASGAPLEVGEGGALVRPPMGEHGGAKATEDSWWAPGPEDLLIKGEEGEYFLELLMREAPLGGPNPASSKVSQSGRREGAPRGKTASAKGMGKKKDKKKAPREKQLPSQGRRKLVYRKRRGVRRADPASRQRQRHLTPSSTRKPRAGAYQAGANRRPGQGQDLRRPQEGSDPDRRSRILEVVVVRRIFNLGTGNLERGGSGKGEVSLRVT